MFVISILCRTMCFIVVVVLLVIYVSYRVYQHAFPSPDINPQGKYVLISGCDTGFGHRLAIDLDRQGFNVFVGLYDMRNEGRTTQESFLASHDLPVGYHATGAHRCCLRAGQGEDQGASRSGEQCRCWHGRVHRLDYGGVDASGDGRELLRTRGDDQTIPSTAGRQTEIHAW